MSGATRIRPVALALRNLRRNRRRSLATLLALVFGCLAVLLFGGYVQNIRLTLETNIVRSAGHLQIQNADFLLFGSGDPQGYSVRDVPRLIEVLRRDAFIRDHVRVISSSLTFNGVAGNFSAGLSKAVVVQGTVADDQARMREWNEYQVPIAPLAVRLRGTAPDAVVIGTGVARILQLCDALRITDCPRPRHKAVTPSAPQTPDDLTALAATVPRATTSGSPRLALLAATSTGAPNVAELQVIDAEPQGTRGADDFYVGVHLPTAQRLVFGQNDPRATSVLLQLGRSADLERVRGHLKALLAREFPDQALAINDFRLLSPSYTQTVAMFDAIFGFISVLITIIVMFTVSNTMNMAVLERTVEIGTLRAMGVRRSGIQRIFVVEGALLGLTGALVGLVIALGVARGLEAMGLTWLPPAYVTPVPLSIHLVGEWRLIGATLLGLVVVAAASAYWPARRASRLEIVEALRHV
ncbi:ABC transporter permease [Roseateles aquatilis]|uniref:ABC transporter permease n=1 Tax=Roseateles aquatilis TaxID=431061 RepID=A0A246JDU3_9BURK|nr:FtsX-like permease family protein [Roseateles aquatilis]OWQ90667.1 ABC transporter permease [Roseateles aquatilis]